MSGFRPFMACYMTLLLTKTVSLVCHNMTNFTILVSWFLFLYLANEIQHLQFAVFTRMQDNSNLR